MTTSNYFPRCVICNQEIHTKTEALGNDMFAHKDCYERYNERQM